jgi:hypothetical protein
MAMEINKFETLKDIKQEINNDLERFTISSARFPVRFIFLNSHEELNEIVDLLTDEAKLVEISSFLYSDNSWFTVNQIVNEIKNINETSVIVPVSEYIRFLDRDSFYNILTGLAEIENTNLKLYIPLVGLWERFENEFLDNYSRRNNWAPIWRLITEPTQINIYQINFEFNKEINTNELKLVSNTKEWFDLWKFRDISNIISLPKPLSIHFKNSLPDLTFTQEIIENPKQYLSKILGIDIKIDYNPKEKEYWDELLIDISNKNNKSLSFRDYFAEKLNIHNISNLSKVDYLDYFFKNINNHYYQWLIKNFYLQSKDFKDSYLAHCFRQTNKLSNNIISRKIFLEIFNLDYSESFLEERRLLLESVNKFELALSENTFDEEFNKIVELDYKKQLHYLTTNTDAEKYKILEITRNNGVESVILDLKTIFPELYYYLNWNLTLNNDIPSWIMEYFEEYNKSKVLNSKSSSLTELLAEKNHPDNFYNWYYDMDKISSVDASGNFIVWIDGLGAEWLPLLSYYLNYFGANNNKKVKYKAINSVYIPTATKFNKVDYNLKFDDLDKFIHDNHYRYPDSLLTEFDYIKDLARQISKMEAPKISIMSDHGFSFLCTKHFGNKKKYDFKNSEHEGRYYLLGDNVCIDNEDYMATETESPDFENQKYVVALKHVSLYNLPSREVHGGVTPEELLIPYIVYEDNDSSIIYEVSSSVSDINISKDDLLPLTVFPIPSSLPLAIYNNKKLQVIKKDNKFFIKLNSEMNKGKQKILIIIDDEEIEELEISIEKGGMKEESYDDLFN